MIKYLGRACVQSHQLPVLVLVPHVGRLEAALQVLKERGKSWLGYPCSADRANFSIERLHKTSEDNISLRESHNLVEGKFTSQMKYYIYSRGTHHLEGHSTTLPQEVENESEYDEEDGDEGEGPAERHPPVLGEVHGEVD